MIIGEKKTGRFVVLLAIALLVGFVALVWFHRSQTPTPTRKPLLHSTFWFPEKPNRTM
jgi:hypothetical protein